MPRAVDYLRANPLRGLRRPPSPDGVAASTVALFGLFALAIGLTSQLLTPTTPDWWQVVILPPILIAYPSLIEEFVFPGIMLPQSLRTAPRSRQALAVAASTAAFVAMHPLNHWLIGLSDTSQFTDPAFLVIVAALGITCAVQYLRTGSLWWPIATHWVTVVAWNLFLGRSLEL